jgi:predicted Zn finger-like uncharacterized protein
MRLICPNCGAQYEVDAKVIPESGRDVQCSNCGHTWFQQSTDVDSDLADELGFEVAGNDATPDSPDVQMPDAPLTDTPADTQEMSENTAQDPEPVARVMAAPQTEEDVDEHDTASEAPRVPVQRSAVSDSVRDILRAEVEYDQNIRAPEPVSLETQPDLGLGDATPKDPKGLRDRMARLRGLSSTSASSNDVPPPNQAAKRRDLLPDIEEINSTLSASSERNDDGTIQDDDTRKERARKTGFRSTFLISILLVVLLVLLYTFAPTLAQKFPALQAILDGFVSGANGFRTWLDTVMTSTSARLNSLLGQLNGNT